MQQTYKYIIKMKETISVSIGTQAFTLDKDAYDRLSDYLDDVRSRLAENEEDTMGDIETRFAEIFIELRPSPMMVVSLGMVEQAIARMGRPEEFGPEKGSRQRGARPQQGDTRPRVIRRSLTNRSIGGVCGGLAEYFNVDVTAVRIATLLLILAGGMSILVYVILWIVIPEETPNNKPYERR